METDYIMEVSAEQIEQVLEALKTQNGSQAAILVFTGIIVVIGLMTVLMWVLNLKLKPLEIVSSSLSDAIKELNPKIAELSKKMWTAEALENKIKVTVDDKIKDHVANCPYKCSLKDQN